MMFDDLYKKSIFFEILQNNPDGSVGAVKESFAFTIPPTSLSITQTQRVTTTPTPGGFFVDNYGLGSAKINISGETGNDNDRLTVLGAGKAPRRLTGKEAYFEFRNRIMRYSQEDQNYTMRFYDLTHKGSRTPFVLGRVSKYTEAWEVVLDESSLNRGSNKPFFYPYSISLTGIRPLGTFNSKLLKNAIAFLSSIRDAIDSVTGAVAGFQEGLDTFLDSNYEFFDSVTDIFTSVTAFTGQFTQFTEQFIEYEQKLGGLFEDVVSESEEILLNGIQIISFPYDILETGRLGLEKVVGKTESLLNTAKAAGKDVVDKYSFDTVVSDVSEISLSIYDIGVSYNEIMRTAKQKSSYEPVGAVAINGTVTPVYGVTPYIVTDNTTLDKLARDLYGDPEMKDVISGLNGIYSNDELVLSDIINVPILQPNVRYANNAVYNLPEEQLDIMGRDASVDNDGVFVVSPNDYAFTSGEETILQAISFRLAEKKGRQVRDGSFGIVAQIGTALSGDAPFEYLSVSLAETLLQDPRITEVYDLNFVGDKDSLYQEFKFDTINKEAIAYREGVI